MEQDEEIARKFPYSEMAKYGWVPASKKYKRKSDQLKKIFWDCGTFLVRKQADYTNCPPRTMAITEKKPTRH